MAARLFVIGRLPAREQLASFWATQLVERIELRSNGMVWLVIMLYFVSVIGTDISLQVDNELVLFSTEQRMLGKIRSIQDITVVLLLLDGFNILGGEPTNRGHHVVALLVDQDDQWVLGSRQGKEKP